MTECNLCSHVKYCNVAVTSLWKTCHDPMPNGQTGERYDLEIVADNQESGGFSHRQI